MKNRAGKHIRTGCMDTASARIYYEIYGEGIPLLMLHGKAGSHREFHSYANQMSSHYQVILMDSRGHGRSRLKRKSARREFTASDMAEDVRLLLGRLRLERAILLGFSDGANTALEFAAHYPDRTMAVISISGNARPSGLCLPVYLFMTAKYHMAGLLGRICPTRRMRRMFGQSRIFASLIVNSPALTGERLRQIKAPVLLIAGTMDLIKVSHTKWMAANIPGSQLILMKGGTHGAFFRERGIYLKCIVDFLDRWGLYTRPFCVRLNTH